MTADHRHPETGRRGTVNSLAVRLLRDEAAATTLEYVLAAVSLALLAIAATRVLAGILVPYLRRIYLVVTLPVP